MTFTNEWMKGFFVVLATFGAFGFYMFARLLWLTWKGYAAVAVKRQS